MNILVCMKQVPDVKTIRINQETHNIIREGVPSILNPCDANALEMALTIRETEKGQVIAVSMGPMQAEAVMQEALDMGADRAVLLCDRLFAGSDTLATGYVLSQAAKVFGADLVLCGAEALDGSTGQVGPVIAENLGWPQITNVTEGRIDGKEVFAVREKREGREHLVCALPAVLCVKRGSNEPRRLSKSAKKPEIFKACDIPLEKERIGVQGSPTRVANISSSDRETGFVVIDGSLPVRERIKMMMNGGMIPRKIHFIRGNAGELADVIQKGVETGKYV